MSQALQPDMACQDDGNESEYALNIIKLAEGHYVIEYPSIYLSIMHLPMIYDRMYYARPPLRRSEDTRGETAFSLASLWGHRPELFRSLRRLKGKERTRVSRVEGFSLGLRVLRV